MTVKDLKRRIEKLKPQPLILLCSLPNGEEAEMSVQEYMSSDADFVRVIRGSELSELDMFLEHEFRNMRVME